MRLPAIVAIALGSTVLSGSAAWCASPQPDIAAQAAAPQPAASPAAAPQAGASAASQPTAASRLQRVKAELEKLSPRKLLSDRLFAKAEKQFPAFCSDWGAKLRERERNNVAHLAWKLDGGGLESTTYVGYGKIQQCSCKQSSKGIPVGKLFYQEFEYKLEGKTLDEARHAAPKPDSITNTTEIFRWDKKQDKWIY